MTEERSGMVIVWVAAALIFVSGALVGACTARFVS